MAMLKITLMATTLILSTLTAFAEDQPAASASAASAPADSAKPEAKPSPSPSAVPSPKPSETPVAEEAPGKIWKAGIYLAPIQIPRLMTAGVEGRIFDALGLSLEKCFFPKVSYKDISAKIDGFEARPRWYPFRGSFFLGLGVGSLSVIGSKTELIAGEAVEVTADVTASYIAPMMGWTWGAKKGGFFYGMELGVHLNTSVKTQVESSSNSPAVLAAQQFVDLKGMVENQARNAIDPFTKYPIPILGLMKFGWMF
ncbi:MAG: hypothetical protein JNL01_08225 [Bdellovibrionales bacterium]|nr:hypothetical protein [Bdellovibrionales bacterium]